jgi:hypothetical protein
MTLLAELNKAIPRSGWMMREIKDADGGRKQVIVHDPDATEWRADKCGTVGRLVGHGVNRYTDPKTGPEYSGTGKL